MDLDKVAAELRRRKGAESIDLGILLGRRFYWDVLKPWLMLVVPTLIVVQLLVAIVIHPVVAVAVGWWMKPLFDRVTLHVISRGFFGDIPAPGETVRTVIRQWRSMEALKDLSWRRLSAARTMTMPIRVLENARGAKARQRIKALYGAGTRPAEQFGLLTMVVGFKWLFYLGLATLAVLVVPLDLVYDPFTMLAYLAEDAHRGVQIAVLIGITTIATTFAEPFFGAGGFGLYIQRRIEREGWDLELRFRRLAERVSSSLDGKLGLWLAATLAALVVLAAPHPAPVHAQDPLFSDSFDDELEEMLEEFADFHIDDLEDYEEEEQFSRDESWDVADRVPPEEFIDGGLIPVDDPAAELEEQMSESPFAPRMETRTSWVPIEDEDDEESRFWQWLEDLLGDRDAAGAGEALNIFALLMRLFIWGLVIAVLGFVLWKIVAYLQARRGAETATLERATRWKEELIEEDEDFVIPEEYVGEEVLKMWAAGDKRRALAVLLVASLIEFEERRKFRFPVGWTTSRCAREVRNRRPEGPVLADVADAFAALAWAGRTPADEEFEALVRRWQSVFEAEGGGL